MAGGRPKEWTPERVEKAKELYLSLLRIGKNELEIDEVENIPSWPYRSDWQKDSSFLHDVQRARAIGASHLLAEGEKIMADTYNRALDEAASPQLVSITDQIMKHRRWKASKFDQDTYGDKSKVENTGPNGGNMVMDINIKFGK